MSQPDIIGLTRGCLTKALDLQIKCIIKINVDNTQLSRICLWHLIMVVVTKKGIAKTVP